MRALILGWFGIIAVALAVGCEERTVYITAPDVQPPATPRGVRSITGDQEVTITWFGSDEPDLDYYKVWRNETGLNAQYFFLARTRNTSYIDYNVVNGNTYYYAISAVDEHGNESDLSPEDVFDTPRPAGFGVRLFSANDSATRSGFDFSRALIVAWNSLSADIYIDQDPTTGSLFINAGSVDVDLQDFGYTSSLDDVDFSPDSGWSNVGWTEVIKGHSYVIWTADNHYAKLRITDEGINWVRFDWAYQIDPGNRELAKPKHDSDYLKRSQVLSE